MKVAITIEVDDDQRNAIATILDVQRTSRKASRAEIRGYLENEVYSTTLALAIWDQARDVLRN
jgi:hypothetical protein